VVALHESRLFLLGGIANDDDVPTAGRRRRRGRRSRTRCCREEEGDRWSTVVGSDDRCRTLTQSSSQSMSCMMTVGELDDGGARRREAAWAL
jgi:hypothetical protein